MPIYEYECKSCGYRFEQLQRISESVLEVCPQCRKKSLVKLISSVGFQLRGSGWYVTDFKNKPTQSSKAEEAATKVNDSKSLKKDGKSNIKEKDSTADK